MKKRSNAMRILGVLLALTMAVGVLSAFSGCQKKETVQDPTKATATDSTQKPQPEPEKETKPDPQKDPEGYLETAGKNLIAAVESMLPDKQLPILENLKNGGSMRIVTYEGEQTVEIPAGSDFTPEADPDALKPLEDILKKMNPEVAAGDAVLTAFGKEYKVTQIIYTLKATDLIDTISSFLDKILEKMPIEGMTQEEAKQELEKELQKAREELTAADASVSVILSTNKENNRLMAVMASLNAKNEGIKVHLSVSLACDIGPAQAAKFEISVVARNQDVSQTLLSATFAYEKRGNDYVFTIQGAAMDEDTAQMVPLSMEFTYNGKEQTFTCKLKSEEETGELSGKIISTDTEFTIAVTRITEGTETAEVNWGISITAAMGGKLTQAA